MLQGKPVGTFRSGRLFVFPGQEKSCRPLPRGRYCRV